jgi:hypothetical protein
LMLIIFCLVFLALLQLKAKLSLLICFLLMCIVVD